MVQVSECIEKYVSTNKCFSKLHNGYTIGLELEIGTRRYAFIAFFMSFLLTHIKENNKHIQITQCNMRIFVWPAWQSRGGVPAWTEGPPPHRREL